MKQTHSKTSIYVSFIVAFLFSLTSLNLSAQNFYNYLILSGNGGPGTTPPGANGYGVILGSSTALTGGVIGSYELVQTTGGAVLPTVNSWGRVILANGNTVNGPVNAKNNANLTGNILSAGSNAVLAGPVNVNGDINIQSGIVTGPVNLTGTYSGPAPSVLPIGNSPAFPAMPAFPVPPTFAPAGATNFNNSASITPGSYGNVNYNNNKTLTLVDTGTYVFNSIDMSGNNDFVYDFQNRPTGVFRIYVHGNAFLGKFNASMINGGDASRIIWIVKGSGAGSSTGSDAVTIANGSNGGNGSVKFLGSIYAYNAGILLGAGTGSSQYFGAIYSRVRVVMQTGATITFSSFTDCTTPAANAGADVSFCSGGNASLGVGPVTGVTYSWSPSTGLSSTTVSNPTVTSSTPGTTTYTVIATSGTCTASDQVDVTVKPYPVANAGSNVSFCSGGSASLGAASASGVTYSWSPSTGLSSTTVSNPTVSSSTPGTTVYTVTATLNGCSASATVSVTVNALPVVNAGTYASVCEEGSPVALSGTPTGGTFSGTAVSANTFYPSIAGPGTFTVTYSYTDGNSCSNTATASITVLANPTISAGTYGPVCIDGSVITLIGTPAGGTFSGTGVSGNSFDPALAGTGTHLITYTYGGTCGGVANTNIVVNGLPNVNAGSNGAHDCLIPSVILAGSSTTPGALYSWTTGTNGEIIANGNTANPEVKVFGTFFITTEDFILTITDPATGCSAKDTTEVSFDPCILPGLDPVNDGKTDEIISTPLVSLYNHYINNGNDCSNPDLDVYIINDQCEVLVEITYVEGRFQDVMNLLVASPFNCTDFPDNTTGNRIIYVFVHIGQLDNLNNLNITQNDNLINHAQTVFKGIPTSGVAFDSCDVAQRSDQARAGFGVDGTGIKVGVVSNSYNTILGNPAQIDVLNDDLPGAGNPNGNTTPVQVLAEYPYGIQTDEGRAMLQIVHDVAPKADLAFATGFITPGNMAKRIKDLQAAGCDVIVDDVTHITESFFTDGIIAKAVDSVVSVGTSYWTSGGNFGNKSYEGIYTPTTAPGSIVGTAHDFGGGDRFQNIYLTPGVYLIVLQWDDDDYSIAPLPVGTSNDLDIYLTYDNGITLFGFNTNNIGKSPFEMLSFTVTQPTTTNILITRESGTGSSVRMKYVVFKSLAAPAYSTTPFDSIFMINEFNTGNSTVVGQANSNGAMTCGAVLYRNTPEFGVSSPTKASFSSVGGTRIHGELVPRNKPDVSTVNGGNTTVYLGSPAFAFDGDPFPNFFGTSAAAPHGAGIAALLLDAKNRYYGSTLTPAEIRSIITGNTVDMYTPGFDFLSGYGLAEAYACMSTLAAPIPVLASLDNLPGGYSLGDTVPSFNLIVTANFITTQSQIVFRDDTLPTTWIDEHHLSAVLPSFYGNPPVQICTPPITPSGDDGGCSNVLYFFSPVQIDVVITAENKSKHFGEMLPAFTATITVDGVPLDSSGYSLVDLGLDDLTFNTPATSMSNAGIYFIQPVADVSDVGLQEIYDYTFTNGLLTISKLPLHITPVDMTVDYGDQIAGTDFDFVYDYDDSNIAPAEQADFLTALQNEYETGITQYVALINDQTIYNGRPLANSDLTNLALICGGRALANGGRALANGGRALANSTTPDTTYLIDVAFQSLYEYVEEDSADITLVQGHPLANGGRGLVNGRPLANGHALANGRPLANGHPLANSSSLDDESNSNVAVIIHETDADSTESDGIISQWYPINLITGTDAGCHYSVPAAFITANFEVTYGAADFCVNPYELKVDAQAATTTYGTTPVYSALITGLQYDDSVEFVLDGTLAFTPSDVCGLNVGTHVITPSGLTLVSPSNYTLVYDTGALAITPAILTATAENKSRPYGFPNPALTTAYSGFMCGDGIANITPPSISTTAVLLSPPGGYPITLSGGSALNYNLNLVNGTLTVQPIPSCSINTPASLPICNQPGNVITATAPAGYTYSWSLTGTGWSITGGNGTTSVTYTAGADGTNGTFVLTMYAPESSIVISSCTLTVGVLCGVEFCTYGQGYWGNPGGTACNGDVTSVIVPGLLTTALVNGDGNRKITIGTTEASCLISKLPAGGSAGQLPVGNPSCATATSNQYLNNGKFKNNLLGQEMALALSVRYNPALGALHITGPYMTVYSATSCTGGLPIVGTNVVYAIPQSVVTYLGVNNTVNDLIVLANKELGSTNPNSAPSTGDISNAVTAFVNAFNGCKIFSGFSATSSGARVENASDMNSEVNPLFVYPNPASGKTTISFVATEGSHAVLDIYGINGAVTAKVLDGAVSENGLYSIDVDCSSFSKGVYFVRLALDNEVSVTKLVIIE